MAKLTPKDLPNIPVAPGAWPIIGHLPSMVKNQFSFLLKQEEDLGPLFWVHSGFGQWSVVVTGKPAHKVMKNKETRSDVMGEDDPVTGYITANTVSIHDGAPHRRIRGSMQAPFTPKGMTAAKIGEVLQQLAEQHISRWKDKQELTILNETSEFALDIIFRMLGVENLDLPQWRKKYNQFIGPFTIIPIDLPGTPRRKSIKSVEWMDKQFAKMIERVRETGDKDTMLGAIVHGTDEDGQGLTEEELYANLRILGLAGHETTAATVAWMFIHLARDKQLWSEIRDEVMAQEAPPTSPKEMALFPKVEALFREVLRLYPVLCLLTPRRVEEPFEVHGVTLPKDTIVAANLLSLSRDPEEYPSPETLDISRWTERERSPRPSEAVQFGGGPHFCLGYHLAVFEGVVYTVVATRYLAQAGLRLSHKGNFPTPSYMPLTRPPSKLQLQFERDE